MFIKKGTNIFRGYVTVAPFDLDLFLTESDHLYGEWYTFIKFITDEFGSEGKTCVEFDFGFELLEFEFTDDNVQHYKDESQSYQYEG